MVGCDEGEDTGGKGRCQGFWTPFCISHTFPIIGAFASYAKDGPRRSVRAEFFGRDAWRAGSVPHSIPPCVIFVVSSLWKMRNTSKSRTVESESGAGKTCDILLARTADEARCRSEAAIRRLGMPFRYTIRGELNSIAPCVKLVHFTALEADRVLKITHGGIGFADSVTGRQGARGREGGVKRSGAVPPHPPPAGTGPGRQDSPRTPREIQREEGCASPEPPPVSPISAPSAWRWTVTLTSSGKRAAGALVATAGP